ncbi:MAG: orotidine-5'-phosphate decarboxylase [Chromatiales bacterium]|jgi:orotidine-5'-phosphate decarboxylase
MLTENPRVIVALDYPDETQALALVDQLDPAQCRLKVGKEMFTRYGPALVEKLAGRGFQIFLDLKFHDIPNTVAAACDAAADLGVWMINLHASGGRRMMEAARERLQQRKSPPLLVAVTILTSLTAEDIAEVGYTGGPVENVLRLAELARRSGMDGVVCSPREAAQLRAGMGRDFLLVTPGVRPRNTVADDQRRVMTPAEAISSGASYLVVGRPITAAADPLAALGDINLETAGY